MDVISYNLASDFEKYLLASGISKKSIRNYRSDLKSFTEWLVLYLRSNGVLLSDLNDSVPHLSKGVILAYLESLGADGVSAHTINRRLSTLRRFCAYLQDRDYKSINIAEGIKNIPLGTRKRGIPESAVLRDFRLYLMEEKTSDNTVRNYVSDVRHFLSWLGGRSI